MTIREAQQTIDRWIHARGVRYFSELTNMAILAEEVGEVARIISRKYGEQSFKKSDKGKVLADVRDMYTTESGGIIPSAAAQHHRAVKEHIFQKALAEAKLTMEDIDVLAFSQGPGLPPSLSVGKDFVKELALKYKKPLVGVNHLLAHLEIGKLFTRAKDPVFVFVSGANTQIIAYEGERYRIFGEALSVGLGNALD